MQKTLRDFASSLAVYIHIPFCRKKCRYCDFFSLETNGLPSANQTIEEYFELLHKELEIEANHYAQFGKVSSIYFGGGTPTLCPVKSISRLINKISDVFDLSTDCEITIEANPESVYDDNSIRYLAESAGLNRISIGCQSFNDKTLQYLGRIHSKRESIEAIERVQKANIKNISIDFMFGIPNETEKDLTSLASILDSYNLNHVSIYELTLEPGTPLFNDMRKNNEQLPTPNEMAAKYKYIERLLNSKGFLRYEISNYAKNANYSRHNLAYWFFQPYLGLGAAAHSMLPCKNEIVRRVNPSSLSKYSKQIKDSATQKTEIVSGAHLANEYLITSFRTSYGIDLLECKEKSSHDFLAEKRDEIMAMEANGYIKLSENRSRLSATNKGMNILNEIALKLSL